MATQIYTIQEHDCIKVMCGAKLFGIDTYVTKSKDVNPNTWPGNYPGYPNSYIITLDRYSGGPVCSNALKEYFYEGPTTVYGMLDFPGQNLYRNPYNDLV